LPVPQLKTLSCEVPLLTGQVYAGVSLLTVQLTKCDGVFSNLKGLVLWNGSESSAGAIQSKAEEEPIKKEKMSQDLNKSK